MQEVVKKEIVKLLDTGIIYPIADSPWVSPIYYLPKKGGTTIVTNENDELVLTRSVTALKHMFKKQDVKPRRIRWILLLQEFDIEIKDKKGIENVAVSHLSRIDNNETSDENEVDDNFPGEILMEINTRDEPWFTDFANSLVGDIIPKGMTYQQKNKFFSDLKHYFWEEPYLFKGWMVVENKHYGEHMIDNHWMERQISFATGTTRTYTPGTSGSNSEKQRTVICYNCKGEGHMSKQCIKPKRKRDYSWFKDKVLLVQAQANGKILHEYELAFLEDPGITEGQAT
nr:reverse transcriptase domain-containing protein [Tanacetum cinerariifolium]